MTRCPNRSHPFLQSAPEHLQAIGHLFGLGAALPQRARVLELGCASGGNLVPFAARYPQAHAVGVDLSWVQIAKGRQNIERLGLTNVDLKNLNLEQIDASLGEFDYIICHGIYNWVPPTVQAAILRICADQARPLKNWLMHAAGSIFYMTCRNRAAAQTRQLAYLADATPPTLFVSNFAVKAAEPLLRECGGSQVMMEQYLDFVVNRPFRQTLLVKQPRASSIRYDSPLTLDAIPQACRILQGVNLTLRTPLHKVVAMALSEHFPSTVTAQGLAQDAGCRLDQPAEVLLPVVLSMLNDLIVAGAVRYRLPAVTVPSVVPAQPQATALARHAALPEESADQAVMVSNAWHDNVKLTLVQRCIAMRR